MKQKQLIQQARSDLILIQSRLIIAIERSQDPSLPQRTRSLFTGLASIYQQNILLLEAKIAIMEG